MFGIYSFSFRKDNDLTGIKALTGTKGHFMIGEVDLSSKAYDGHDLETACFQRIEQEIQPKNGLQHYTRADLNDFQFFLCDGDENHQDTKFRDYITHMNPKIRPLKDRSCGANTEILTGISKDEIKDYFQAWQYGVPKDSLYGIDIDPRNVAFLRRCGFKHVVCGDALLPETWEKLGK